MKVLRFTTNLDVEADYETIQSLLHEEKKIHWWNLEKRAKHTELVIVCDDLNKDNIEAIVTASGFECKSMDE